MIGDGSWLRFYSILSKFLAQDHRINATGGICKKLPIQVLAWT